MNAGDRANAADRARRELVIKDLIEMREAPFTTGRHRAYLEAAIAELMVIPPFVAGDRSLVLLELEDLHAQLADIGVQRPDLDAIVERAIAQLRRDVLYLESLASDRHGAINMAMEVVDGQVVVGFGQKVGWLSFAWRQAEALGQALLVRAEVAKLMQRRSDGEEAHGEGAAAARPQGDGAHEAFEHDGGRDGHVEGQSER